MKKAKKLLALLLTAATMLSLLAACGGDKGKVDASVDKPSAGDIALPPGGTGQPETPDASATPAYVQTKPAELVRVAVADAPTNITPWSGTSNGRNQVLLSNVYQCLLEGVQRTEEVRLIMAEKLDRAYAKTENGEMHRIYLYQDIYDSDGNHFTAEDAVFCLQSAVAEAAIPAVAFIGETKVVDEYTLDVEILSFNRAQLAASVSNVNMVTKKAYEASPDGMASNIVATGPYKIESWVSGDSVNMVKVENYWGADMGERSDDIMNPWMWHAQNVNRIEFKKISEPAQAAIALETNSSDIAIKLTPTEVERFAGQENFSVYTMYDTLTLHTYFNCTDKSPFADVRLRQAVAYAIDRQAVMDANGGYGMFTNTFGSHLFADYVDDWDNHEYYPYDPEKARELIKESGFDTNREIVILVANTSKYRTTTAAVVQAMLMDVGFKVRIDTLDGASFAANRFNPDIQDIRIDQQAFENLANLWNQHLNYTVKGHPANLLQKDEKLQELVTKVQMPEYHTPEYMTEAHEYIMENCYIYSIHGLANFDVVNSKLVAADGGKNNRLQTPIGSFTYYV